MLKVLMDNKAGGKLVVLGLSHENLKRLKAGQPIKFAGDEIDLPGTEFLIFVGKTEQSMARELADLVGPKTRTSISPRVTDA